MKFDQGPCTFFNGIQGNLTAEIEEIGTTSYLGIQQPFWDKDLSYHVFLGPSTVVSYYSIDQGKLAWASNVDSVYNPQSDSIYIKYSASVQVRF